MKFEYYVLCEDANRRKIERFNIFRNYYVQQRVEKAIKKYLRCPSKYKYIRQYANEFIGAEEIALYGFEALCAEIRSTIMNQMWARCEYEIAVGSLFTTEIHELLHDIDKYNSINELKEGIEKISQKNNRLEKWDAFKQCELNIPMITRECIYQYKKQLKENKK